MLRLLRIKDKEHSIAIGFSIGVLINFIPTFGFGPVLSTISPKLVKGNPIAGFIGGVAFIWAFPFMFLLNVIVGKLLLHVSFARAVQAASEPAVMEVGFKLGKAFFLGMTVNLIFFGIAIYFVVYVIVKKFRREALMFVYKHWKI
ncbi:hypothetical protein SAMN05421736_12355 [Evansella caseinilytica]|uniref:DUF2062 domain-containing protein n=1 Tax=Evansella caseinilytica TaxID=1503961 RepID=A0A1H3UMD3_9BACI|nr:hypothetical protein SAMN05421736_12355 [Evansella caseinilytica]